MRPFLVSLVALTAVYGVRATAFPISQCNIPITSGQQPVLEKVYSKYQAQMAAWHDGQEICAVEFQLKASQDAASGACTFTEPERTYTLKSLTATMKFRDAKGELYTVSYPVCQGDDATKAWVGDKYSDLRQIPEANFRFQTVVVHKEDKIPENEDDNCDTNRRVDQIVCAPENYKVFAWTPPAITERSSQSQLIGVAPSPSNSSCVVVSFDLVGRGYDEVLGQKVNCREHAKFKYNIGLKAVSSAATPVPKP